MTLISAGINTNKEKIRKIKNKVGHLVNELEPGMPSLSYGSFVLMWKNIENIEHVKGKFEHAYYVTRSQI